MMMMVIFEAIAFLIFINVLCHLSFFDFISKIDFLYRWRWQFLCETYGTLKISTQS